MAKRHIFISYSREDAGVRSDIDQAAPETGTCRMARTLAAGLVAGDAENRFGGVVPSIAKRESDQGYGAAQVATPRGGSLVHELQPASVTRVDITLA